MKKTAIIIGAALTLASCCGEPVGNHVNVIPQPASVKVYEGALSLAGASFMADKSFGEDALEAIKGFESNLEAACGAESGAGQGRIIFKRNPRMEAEEYSITVCGKKATVKASGLNGVLYALETMKQMLPVEIYTGSPATDATWTLPYMKIQDKPRFGYRGMHLDVARHFFDVDQVKKYLDIMAIHKLNTFHWHLTDDQGWRIEIKKYPELTQKGSVRKETLVGHYRDNKGYDGTPYGEGMWYTQEQIREVVDHAAAKGITVIPEIDLPGHMVAALATYPELGCTGGPYEVRTSWGIAKEVLCVGKESTFEFLENVLAEVCELFPSEYIHIGGDECPKDSWKNCPHCQAKIAELGLKDDDRHKAEHYLQSHVTKRIEEFLATRGKKIIGWDEILEGELAPNATVMSWRGVEGGLEAVRQGHDAIMVPSRYLYLDYYQSEDRTNEPLGIGGFVSVEKVYSFEPFTEDMTDKEKSHILGIQANLWTEYIGENWHLEYMLLPRMSALSEIQWCPQDGKDYERFLENMKGMAKIYDALGYNYAKHIF